MHEIYLTKIFERRAKIFLEKHPELEKELEIKLDYLICNPFSPSLKTHKLSGKLKKHWAFSLTYEYRILFIMEGNKIYLTNIGSHDEIY